MYLCLDVGEKKTGIAVSDESLTIANPKEVIKTKNLKKELQDLFKEKKYTGVVIGHSTDFSGKENEIMGKVYSVKAVIEKTLENTNTKVHLHQEIYSTRQASRDGSGRDDEAAAIILQSFLDTKKLNNNKI